MEIPDEVTAASTGANTGTGTSANASTSASASAPAAATATLPSSWFSLQIRRLFQFAAPTALGLNRLDVKWSKPDRVPQLPGAWASMVWLAAADKTASGFAIDTDPKLLAVKSLMESCECLATKDAAIALESRTGLAAHLDLENAKRAAFHELIERDAFLYHWLTETPALAILSPEDFWPGGPRCQLVELSSAVPGVYVVLAAASIEQHGCWNLGMGAANTLPQAARKALLEWGGGLYRHKLAGQCPGDGMYRHDPVTGRRQGIETDPISRHHLHSRTPEISALLEYILHNKAARSDERVASAPSIDSCTFQTLATRSLRYAVVLARHEGLLPLHFGERFTQMREAYLRNPRVAAALSTGGKPRFHPRDRFLPHPFD